MFQIMGIPDIMVEQMIAMVSYWMMHGTSDTLTGEAVRALAEQVHMEIGMGTPLVQLPYEKFGTWKSETLLTTMWKNLGCLEI